MERTFVHGYLLAHQNDSVVKELRVYPLTLKKIISSETSALAHHSSRS